MKGGVLVFLKIGEFASRIGATTTTLREWEKRGWLVPHHRSPSGYRYYSEEQVKQVLSGELNQKGNAV